MVDVYLAYYVSWPEEVTVVGVFDSTDRAVQALEQSDAPPEGGARVAALALNGRVEYHVD